MHQTARDTTRQIINYYHLQKLLILKQNSLTSEQQASYEKAIIRSYISLFFSFPSFISEAMDNACWLQFASAANVKRKSKSLTL